MLHTFEKIDQLREAIAIARAGGRSIGFVPTMGALHEGHLALMRKALQENEYLVVSVFVNPIQFNNPIDLEKYPRTLERDTAMLQSVGCHALFAPSVAEMYPEPDQTQFNFGKLATVMEGAFRPGHFNGVAIVVKKLFEIVEPDKAYFGEKDFQQLAIIKELVVQERMKLNIVPCATVREADGLAMSSRNTRLSQAERAIAPNIYKILSKAATLRNVLSPDEMRSFAKEKLEAVEGFLLEYVEVADDRYLQPVAHWNDVAGARIFVALQLGPVRLIDNVRIF